MSDQSSNSSISSDEAENIQAGESSHQIQQQQPQHSDEESSSMSSTTSSGDEAEQQNTGVEVVATEQEQQQHDQQHLGESDQHLSESDQHSSVEEDATSEVIQQEQNEHHEEEEEASGANELAGEGRDEEEVEDEDDGIFTTKDDEQVLSSADGNEEEADEMMEKRHREDEHEGDEEGEEHHNEDETAALRTMERMDVSDDEEQAEEVDTGPKKIELNIARCKADLGDEGLYFVKMPNFLSIETKPFDVETYDDELEEDEMLDEDGRTRLKLKLENTIRWRTVQDEQGNEKRESNAKIVRWSDGSMSMYLGNEIFEVDKQRIMDFNHLYIRQGVALQAQAVFNEKLVFRPHSTETLTHRKMTMNMAEKTSKAQKVRMLANVGDNPNAQRKEMIRLEEEKLRASARREAQQRRVRERPRAVGLTSGFLEGYDSDEGVDSLAAIKRRYQHAPYGMERDLRRSRSYSESDEEQDERQRKTINEAKIDSEEEDEGGGGGGEEGETGEVEEMETSDTEQRPRSSQTSSQRSQQKRKIVIEDDEGE